MVPCHANGHLGWTERDVGQPGLRRAGELGYTRQRDRRPVALIDLSPSPKRRVGRTMRPTRVAWDAVALGLLLVALSVVTAASLGTRPTARFDEPPTAPWCKPGESLA